MSKKAPMHYDASNGIFENANVLRKESTFAEILLWEVLRNRRLGGLKFRRQHPVKKFILDFYCRELNLAVEVDGEIHLLNKSREYDEERTKDLESLGIKVLRFTNEEIQGNINYVKKTILNFK